MSQSACREMKEKENKLMHEKKTDRAVLHDGKREMEEERERREREKKKWELSSGLQLNFSCHFAITPHLSN